MIAGDTELEARMIPPWLDFIRVRYKSMSVFWNPSE